MPIREPTGVALVATLSALVVACADSPPPDADRDGVADGADVCPLVADPAQADGDGDGVGDACEDPTTQGVFLTRWTVRKAGAAASCEAVGATDVALTYTPLDLPDRVRDVVPCASPFYESPALTLASYAVEAHLLDCTGVTPPAACPVLAGAQLEADFASCSTIVGPSCVVDLPLLVLDVP